MGQEGQDGINGVLNHDDVVDCEQSSAEGRSRWHGQVGRAGGTDSPLLFQYAELLKIIVYAIDVYTYVLHKLWETMIMVSIFAIVLWRRWPEWMAVVIPFTGPRFHVEPAV